MKVLVIGSGGREHALVWKLHQSKKVKKIYCAPGNAGIKKLATCVDCAADDIDGLLAFALKEKIDLTVVGPEDPLTLGIVDTFQEHDLRIFGPSARGAILEGSKVFTKDFLKKYGIPSSAYKVFTKAGPAKKYIDKLGAPCVVKADGLAAGKGVIVAHSKSEAKKAVDLILKEKAFGEAGNRVVVEEFLRGEEASFIAFTDGTTVLPLPSSQDHKAIFEGDRGPNTGGMGAYSPAPVMTEAMVMRVMNEVMLPTVRGMAAEGRPFKGMLYAGLMIDGDRINVLEFNCRFGDPECQPLLMRMETDLVDILDAVVDETLDQVRLEIDSRPAVCVVMASEGYPGPYSTDKPITGLMTAAKMKDVVVFHAGTRIKNRRTVTAGGRVLGVTAIGSTLQEALDRAYKAVDVIRWDGRYFRRDIGHRALRRGSKNKGPQVGIVMGSDSDLPIMQAAGDFLEFAGIEYELRISSAHRTPEQAAEYARTAADRGLKIIIAGAGMAAHLAGVLAAHTNLPVIGVPIDASSLNGLDALLSTVQMPPGIPVATMGIGKAGAKNAAVLAARIIGLNNPKVARVLEEHCRAMVQQVEEKNEKIAR
ncbi:MAG TPA: phosphoribosylamine--glycine ligase [Desulfobulbus sp.]|nr:phosphoribosylamine--glycine ligase [Desulfobulbus sp.]